MSAPAISPLAPRRILKGVYYPLYRTQLRLRCILCDALEGWMTATKQLGIPLPPAMLRFRVGESTNARRFLNVGRASAENLALALKGFGRPFERLHSILDFGCGCGRTLVWLATGNDRKKFYGTDVDLAALTWCAQHISSARFAANAPSPPLPFPDSELDLVYGISVLTHWDDVRLREWIPEFHRVLKPGGVLLLTLHGEHVWKSRPPDASRIVRDGFAVVVSSKLAGIHPVWYQTAFFSREYIVSALSGWFPRVEYQPRSFGDQDAVLAQRE